MLASLLARTAAQMSAIVVVLFALHRFHSATVAGLAVFASSVPGLLVSPLAGALLDRHRRIRLIRLDYTLVAAALLTITGLDAAGRLTPPLLLLVIAVGSLSLPLSSSGTRSLFPLMVPERLWDRANAVDSAGYVIASIVGPAIAGLVAGTAGPRAGILAVALVYLAAVAGLTGLAEPASPATGTTPPLVAAARQGLAYVIRHPTLRAIAVVTTVLNLGVGILTVALPVLVISHLGGGDTSVGLLWTLAGVTGIGGVVLAGRLDTSGREGRLMTAAVGAQALALALLAGAAAFGGGIVVAALGMAVFGVATGPFDVAMFSLRQRVTDPAWMGRAFAVSMSLNWLGMPVASALVGPAVVPHLAASFVAAVAVSGCRPGRPGGSSSAAPRPGPCADPRYNHGSPAARRAQFRLPAGWRKGGDPDPCRK